MSWNREEDRSSSQLLYGSILFQIFVAASTKIQTIWIVQIRKKFGLKECNPSRRKKLIYRSVLRFSRTKMSFILGRSGDYRVTLGREATSDFLIFCPTSKCGQLERSWFIYINKFLSNHDPPIFDHSSYSKLLFTLQPLPGQTTKASKIYRATLLSCIFDILDKTELHFI